MSDVTTPETDSVYFSRQLSGWLGHILFAAVVLLTALSLWGSFSQSLPPLFLMLALLLLYLLIGTIGWSRVIRQHTRRAVYRYFLIQFGLIALMLAVELQTEGVGLSTSILGLGLTLQSCVLPAKTRLLLFGGLLVLTTVFYTPSIRVTFTLERLLTYVLLFAAAYSVGIFVGMLIVREERARETSRRLDESNRKLAHYMAEVETLSTVRERNRLAREIHDNIGHYLTAINIQLEVAMLELPPEQRGEESALLKAQSLTKEALSEIRRSISALRATPVENRTLNEAISLLVEEHRQTGNRVSFEVVGTVRPCSASVEMALYRIAQEALTNVRKHAAGGSAAVKLSYTDDGTISLEVRDDGQGTERYDDGFGLLGIRERVEVLGGTISIETGVGRGFLLRVMIPG